MRSSSRLMQLVEFSSLRVHLVDRYVDRSTATVDHHVPYTFNSVQHCRQAAYTLSNGISKQSCRYMYGA